ncbi:biotin transporter BioY [Paenibacillus lentus]|uniref:Biotin transporter n=1 Tax=Paenibacillus lentus TaxID=1338368 RepID=A0A3S8RWB7_9BACL|nr:biotin transporter BioY [Paenibacillus lentus]AZK47445.1 biotin transporter BioY [Paenibacillus lentus]
MKIKDMMYVALFAAVMAVLGLLPPIPLPFIPVPITAQTLGVMLAGSILGARLGGLSLFIFIIIVAAGAPLLPGGRGGLAVFASPTGGYILSWPIAALIIGYFVQRASTRINLWKLILINSFGGILVIYAIGIPYMSIITEVPMGKAALGNITFIPGDLLKVVVASLIAIRMLKVNPHMLHRESSRSHKA